MLKSDVDLIDETVPCRICSTPTEMTGTKLCNPCWEMEKGIERILRMDSKDVGVGVGIILKTVTDIAKGIN